MESYIHALCYLFPFLQCIIGGCFPAKLLDITYDCKTVMVKNYWQGICKTLSALSVLIWAGGERTRNWLINMVLRLVLFVLVQLVTQ